MAERRDDHLDGRGPESTAEPHAEREPGPDAIAHRESGAIASTNAVASTNVDRDSDVIASTNADCESDAIAIAIAHREPDADREPRPDREPDARGALTIALAPPRAVRAATIEFAGSVRPRGCRPSCLSSPGERPAVPA